MAGTSAKPDAQIEMRRDFQVVPQKFDPGRAKLIKGGSRRRNRRTLRCLLWSSWALIAPSLFSHDVITTNITWTQEISRVFQKRCQTCHAANSSIPLTTYDEARPWAKAVRDQVLQRKMPPWGAVKGVGEFRNDPSLTALEVEMITQWVEGGVPKGDDAYLPPPFKPVDRPLSFSCSGPDSEPVMRLPASLELSGILPVALRPGAELEVTAAMPDQSVKHLLWIRDYPATGQQPFILRSPMRLPAGTSVRVDGGRVRLCR